MIIMISIAGSNQHSNLNIQHVGLVMVKYALMIVYVRPVLHPPIPYAPELLEDTH